MKLLKIILISILCTVSFSASAQFKLNSSGYFQNGGVDVMAFDDIYPEGHQGGVGVIMHGHRIATNGDIRLEATPGQWQAIPKQRQRLVEKDQNRIVASLSYPDSSKHLKGFNPIVYPDINFNYTVNVESQGNAIVVTVDLDHPIPESFIGKVGFNLEFYPTHLFGKSWIMDKKSGIFPQQPNAPTVTFDPQNKNFYNPIKADEIIAAPYAVGKKLIILPDDPYSKMSIESQGSELKLYDGRVNHNNGWFVVRSEIASGATRGAVKWIITPNIVPDWQYSPVIQISQLGYHPDQPKTAIIELDKKDEKIQNIALYRYDEQGKHLVKNVIPEKWGQFLRYNYLKYDFSDIKEEGLYQLVYGETSTHLFRIAKDIYDRGAWQPVLEYFLPVQMCHMRVNEKYRVWHGCCHMDDARMAPTDHNHFDGYVQGPSTLTKYKSGDVVPGLNIGGWHDAGDYDLRVESQAGEAYILSLAYENFKVDYDETSVDQHKRITEIHLPDGKPDLLQQIEHGALSVVGAYRSLGRLYRGIICNNLRQYVLLGDGVNMTDNILGNEDDRWVFTEINPKRELTTAANLAAVSRVLKGFNDTLSTQALDAAKHIFKEVLDNNATKERIHAATELFLTTGDPEYKNYLLSQTEYICQNINGVAWFIGRADQLMQNKDFSKSVKKALNQLQSKLQKDGLETPYGIPYRPHIWGAGWDIQAFGFRHYFLVKSYPEIFKTDFIYNALNFVLGCHPGSNTESFASGVGANSATVAYGINRGDWSYIPGGVISGTALIRPDFPELLRFPFLWQQTEYVMGGGSSHYMFLVLAAKQLLTGN